MYSNCNCTIYVSLSYPPPPVKISNCFHYIFPYIFPYLSLKTARKVRFVLYSSYFRAGFSAIGTMKRSLCNHVFLFFPNGHACKTAGVFPLSAPSRYSKMAAAPFPSRGKGLPPSCFSFSSIPAINAESRAFSCRHAIPSLRFYTFIIRLAVFQPQIYALMIQLSYRK